MVLILFNAAEEAARAVVLAYMKVIESIIVLPLTGKSRANKLLTFITDALYTTVLLRT